MEAHLFRRELSVESVEFLGSGVKVHDLIAELVVRLAGLGEELTYVAGRVHLA